MNLKRVLYLGICLDLVGEAVAAKILLSVPHNCVPALIIEVLHATVVWLLNLGTKLHIMCNNIVFIK